MGIYDLDNYQPLKALGHLMGKVRGQLLTALAADLLRDEELGPLEITAAQFIVLVRLADNAHPIAISELCKQDAYDAGAMTRMLDRLEAKGLIQRSRSGEDRRVVLLELTQAGRTAYPRLRAVSMRVMNRSLGDFSPQEAQQLETLLLRMSRNILEPQP